MCRAATAQELQALVTSQQHQIASLEAAQAQPARQQLAVAPGTSPQAPAGGADLQAVMQVGPGCWTAF